jgi:hypothetical protein
VIVKKAGSATALPFLCTFLLEMVNFQSYLKVRFAGESIKLTLGSAGFGEKDDSFLKSTTGHFGNACLI